MSAARYGVRLPNGQRACVCRGCCSAPLAHIDNAYTERRNVAVAVAKALGGKVVRVGGNAAESRRKAAAEALRELAADYQLRSTIAANKGNGSWLAWSRAAEIAESRADALWPRKGAGR